ncbi:methyltransferase domain-containing protein [Xylaria sp. FL1042]|nr:methyltransferase domain-containing protein [Xylaria sp. FL1042]
MCLTTHYISRNCGHHWLAIRYPCWPGNGFNYCGVFGDGCPACATPGAYDHNLVRMVVNIRDHCRWGMGPSRDDPGYEYTSHVSYERVYEPAEDSFLFLDTLSSASETSFLQSRFPSTTAEQPLVVEIGPGSGVVIAFITAHAATLFGTRRVLTGAVDMNAHACAATAETVRRAISANPSTAGMAFLGAVQGDLAAPLRDRSVDVLVFNPPYVPTAELPSRRQGIDEEDSYLLALSYAGGRDGMETTNRLLESLPRVLSDRGCAYVLLCAQNKPEEVKERVRSLDGGGGGWKVETVGSSGKKAGWEKLQIIRIWREL